MLARRVAPTYDDPGDDVVDGGPGIDLAVDWMDPEKDYNPPVSITMDGVANPAGRARPTTSRTSRTSPRRWWAPSRAGLRQTASRWRLARWRGCPRRRGARRTGQGLAFTVKGLTLAVPCAAACKVTAVLTVDKATARKLRLGRAAKIGGGSAALKTAGTAKLKLKLARKAKRVRKATLKVTVTTAAGKQTATRALKLGR